MIYSIVGTKKEIRDKANEELSSFGKVARHLYSEDIDELESFVDASSLFEEKVVIVCVQLAKDAQLKEKLFKQLNKMESSSNIFIVDEPFADIHLINKLSKISKKLFNAKEEKIKDVSVFRLCDSFALRDKKKAWMDFMHVRKIEGGESIQGALWWKWKNVWEEAKKGKKSPYSLEEYEKIGGEIVKSVILAHRGEKDLMTELERIILSI